MEEILGIAVCLALNAWLAGTEMAFVTVGRARLREEARKGSRAASRILKLREKPERTLSVIQVGITAVAALAAAVGGAGAQESLQPRIREALGLGDTSAELVSILLVVAPITFVSVVLGELVPKSLALRNPVRTSLRAARWLYGLDRALSPLVTVFEWSTNAVLALFPHRSERPKKESGSVELDELSKQTREYVVNLVALERRRIRDVYVPWADVVSVSAGQSVNEVEQTIVRSGHTRLPVIDGDEVVGLLNTKEFMALRASGTDDWSDMVRPILRVDEMERLPRTLRRMQLQRSHLGLVTAEGRKVGIVTMEDILEEVIGEVYDEDDDGALRRILGSSATFRSVPSRRR
jgi:putative hemolysin